MLIIGKVLKPHGVRGGLKVKSFMDIFYIFSEIKNIFIAEIEYKIEKVQPSANFVILQLEGINSIEDAEKFRNAEIFLKKEQAPKLPKGRYYIDELLCCDIYINDEKVGKLRD